MSAMNVSKAVAILRDPAQREAAGIKSVSEHTASFYEFIADRLAGGTSGNTDKELVPIGYNLCIELALNDAQEGIDGFNNNRPLRGKFVELPIMMYSIMAMPLFKKEVITALFNEEFAEEVLKVRAEIEKHYD